MSKIKLPVTWECSGFIEVEAASIKDGINHFNENSDNIPLPTDFEYTDGSFTLGCDEIEYIESLQNTEPGHNKTPTETNSIGGEMLLRMFRNQEN